jgi:DNA-binding GntR family transcriptional regulator
LDRELSMTDRVYLETRFHILSGVYEPGKLVVRNEMAAVFECSGSIILDAFSTLLAEGYLESPKRGLFSVRLWSQNQFEDYYDMWATLSCVAVARAAERADKAELEFLASRFSFGDILDFTLAGSVERHILEFAGFNAELIRVSRAAPLLNMSHKFIPNFLFRKGFWCSTADNFLGDREALERLVDSLVKRKSSSVKDQLREIVLRPLSEVIRGAAEQNWAEGSVSVVRFNKDEMRNGCVFSLGGREPALDGIVVPYGIPLN